MEASGLILPYIDIINSCVVRRLSQMHRKRVSDR